MSKYGSRLFFPLSLLAAGASAAAWLHAELSPAALPIVITVAALVLVVVAERVSPHQGRAPDEGETRTDLAFVVLTAVFAQPLAVATVTAAAALLTGTVLRDLGGLASGLPVWLGAPGVLLVGGLGDYWAHRLSHETSWWWRLHAVHHAPRRMVALNNFRLHPLDLALKIAFALLPVLALGFSAEAIAAAGSIKGVTLSFQHADLDLRHGWLNRVFSTNALHRWHHSAAPREANTNYGGTLSVFDQLFGTFYAPPEVESPARTGLFEERAYPVHVVWRAVAAPFCWRRCVMTERPASRP